MRGQRGHLGGKERMIVKENEDVREARQGLGRDGAVAEGGIKEGKTGLLHARVCWDVVSEGRGRQEKVPSDQGEEGRDLGL